MTIRSKSATKLLQFRFRPEVQVHFGPTAHSPLDVEFERAPAASGFNVVIGGRAAAWRGRSPVQGWRRIQARLPGQSRMKRRDLVVIGHAPIASANISIRLNHNVSVTR